MTARWWCSRGEHPTDVPHTDPETGDDVCPDHCASCRPELAAEWGIDLDVTTDDLQTAADATPKAALVRVPVAGHGILTRDQAARGEGGWG